MDFNWKLVESSSDFEELLSELDTAKVAAIDTETTGIQPYNGSRLTGISFYFPETKNSYYISFRHGTGQLNNTDYPDEYGNMPALGLQALIHHHRWTKIKWIMFNALFDMAILYQDNFPDMEAIEDVMIAAKLLNENENLSHGLDPETGDFNFGKGFKGAFKLKRLAKKYLGEWAAEGEHELEQRAIDKNVEAKTEMWKMSAQDVAKYACFDTILTWELRQFYMPHLSRWQVTGVYDFQNVLMLKYWFRAQRNGVLTDRNKLIELRDKAANQLQRIEKYFQKLAAEYGLVLESIELDEDEELTDEFNPNSNAQMLALFRSMGYELDAVNKFARMPFVRRKILPFVVFEKYQEISKAYSSYYTTYLDHLTASNRLHGGFFVYGTVAGRPSCSKPNLFQVAKNSPVKTVMVCPDGYTLVSIDYDRMELYIAAHFGNEEQMLEMIRSGEDMHQYTADKLTNTTGVPVDRQEGKVANFGLTYGMGWRKFSTTYGVPEDLSQVIVKSWRKLYAGIRGMYYSASNIAKLWRDVDGKVIHPSKGKAYQYIRIPISGKIRHFHEPAMIRAKREKLKNFDVLEGETYEHFWKEKIATEDMVQQPFDEHMSAWNNIVQGTAWGVMEQALLEMVEEFPDNDVLQPLFPVYDSNVAYVRNDMLDTVIPKLIEIMTDNDRFKVPLTVEAEISTTNYKEMRVYGS